MHTRIVNPESNAIDFEMDASLVDEAGDKITVVQQFPKQGYRREHASGMPLFNSSSPLLLPDSHCSMSVIIVQGIAVIDSSWWASLFGG